MKLPIKLTQDDFASRKVELIAELGLTEAQVEALANGTGTGEGPCVLGPSWLIEVDKDGWVLVCADEDVDGKPVVDPLDENIDCAPVWMNPSGYFAYGPIG